MRELGIGMLLSTWAAFALCFACDPATTSSGDLVGNFAINATLRSNDCRPGYNPAATTSFAASLHVSGANATWSAGGSSVTGSATGTSIHVVATSSMTPYSGCVIDQTETIDATYTETPTDSGTPDAGTHSATISGTDTITRSTSSGPPCADILLINGGIYPSLPCSATFDFTGTTN
jgi:hypothetical protein